MIKSLLQWLLPYTCVLCGETGEKQHDLCQGCRQELPWLTYACPQCAQPYATASHSAPICGMCLKHPPPYDCTVAAFEYKNPVDYFIGGLKFHSHLVYARLLGELLLLRLNQHYEATDRPQAIIPMPLHLSRLRERGFNQAVEIARPIAKAWQLPLIRHACQRTRATPAQSSLPATERQRNVKKAFAVRQDFYYQHVAVLDDVITTGSTVREISKQLRQQGIKKIDLWCCAKTGVG